MIFTCHVSPFFASYNICFCKSFYYCQDQQSSTSSEAKWHWFKNAIRVPNYYSSFNKLVCFPLDIINICACSLFSDVIICQSSMWVIATTSINSPWVIKLKSLLSIILQDRNHKEPWWVCLVTSLRMCFCFCQLIVFMCICVCVIANMCCIRISNIIHRRLLAVLKSSACKTDKSRVHFAWINLSWDIIEFQSGTRACSCWSYSCGFIQYPQLPHSS